MTFKSRTRRGFTLIEMLIVIVVIAILALIVIPRLMQAGRKAKESTLKANLHQLRNAISHFEADTGVYPETLMGLVAPANSTPNGHDGQPVPTGTYQGPYLTPNGGIVVSDSATGIPCNPFEQTSAAISDHWLYSTGDGLSAGEIQCATEPGETLDGIDYQEL